MRGHLLVCTLLSLYILFGTPSCTPPISPTETHEQESARQEISITDSSERTDSLDAETLPEPPPQEQLETIQKEEKTEPATPDKQEPTPEETTPEREAMPEPLPDKPKPFGLLSRPSLKTCTFPDGPDSLLPMTIEDAFPKLPNFAYPLQFVVPPDNSNRIFVVSQYGWIKIFKNDPNATSTTFFLSIANRIVRGGELGLLGLAFHPQFKTNGYVYINYTAGNPLRTVVSRITVSKTNPDVADMSTELVLLEQNQPASNHNGGMMAFGTDGYLYISFGDGGGKGDPNKNGQNLSTILGSIIRIDVDKQDPGMKYAIPKDNPFYQTAGARKEIWAYGLRNVWRFSFDRLTGTMWAGDVGQIAYEEIDIIVKGGNYGWNVMEGNHCYPATAACNKQGFIPPIIDHGRGEAKSITGGYVYRGTRLPTLYGAYIYADFVTGNIWALRYDGKSVTDHKLLTSSNKKIASFGEDSTGELYFTSFDGRIYRLKPQTPGGNQTTFPTKLSDTKCFTSLKTMQPVTGLLPYSVNTPLWSDGLQKERWFGIPDTTKITFHPDKAWEFPDGSVIIKHFSMNAIKGDPSTKRHIETRFLLKAKGDWRGYTYMWNDAQTEAYLLDGRGKTTVYQKDTSTNRTAIIQHTVPSRADCMTCHTAGAGRVLGLETRQMNRSHPYTNATDNQLRTLDHIGMFTQPLANANTYEAFPSIQDTTVSLEKRARAYLHSNCANCHRPQVSGTAKIDLRATTPLSQMQACNTTPEKGDLGITGAKLLIPGNPVRSLIYVRMAIRQEGQMPQLGTTLVDAEASALIRAWIQGLKTCP